jgi:hypothetical protein
MADVDEDAVRLGVELGRQGESVSEFCNVMRLFKSAREPRRRGSKFSKTGATRGLVGSGGFDRGGRSGRVQTWARAAGLRRGAASAEQYRLQRSGVSWRLRSGDLAAKMALGFGNTGHKERQKTESTRPVVVEEVE